MNKTHVEHVRRVAAVHGDRLTVAGTYTHSFTKIDYHCPKHGNYFAYPSNVETGYGCRHCAVDRHRLTHDDYINRVQSTHGDRVRVVGRFIDSHTKIQHECPKHGIWLATPANVIHRQSGCRRCYEGTISARCRKTHAAYVSEATVRGVEVLGTYTGAHDPILHRCLKGHEWETKPNQILSGYGCPRCDQSQYKRRPIQVGDRTVLVQGAEGKAVAILLEEGVEPADLAFRKKEGLPTFRYRFDGRWRLYIPDFYRISLDQVIEVKSAVTFGIYDEALYEQVRAKARAALRADRAFRLMVIHRNQLIDLGRGWHRLSWVDIVERFKRRSRAKDRRLGRNRRSQS